MNAGAVGRPRPRLGERLALLERHQHGEILLAGMMRSNQRRRWPRVPCRSGRATPETRGRGGDGFARLVRLQLRHRPDDLAGRRIVDRDRRPAAAATQRRRCNTPAGIASRRAAASTDDRASPHFMTPAFEATARDRPRRFTQGPRFLPGGGTADAVPHGVESLRADLWRTPRRRIPFTCAGAEYHRESVLSLAVGLLPMAAPEHVHDRDEHGHAELVVHRHMPPHGGARSSSRAPGLG